MISLPRGDKIHLVDVSKSKMEKDKIVFKGSHPDSLYRVAAGGGVGAGKMARVLRVLRWPAALLLVCVALAAFVYFLMPDNIESDMDRGNASYWEAVAASAGAQAHRVRPKADHKPEQTKRKEATSQGTRTSEIDFYDADTDKNFGVAAIIDSATETSANRKLPIEPVFPAYIVPEVQYGNEKADADKIRIPKILDEKNMLPEDSTLKPHITQKPEKPLEIYFRDGNGITTTLGAETIAKAETLNDYTNYGEKYGAKKTEEPRIKPHIPVHKDHSILQPNRVKPIPQVYEKEAEIPPEIQEFYQRRPSNVDVNFTSGHSKVFGLSIEDAQKMRSTTQSSAYNTRVSPTLPTWRDGDDSTTKNYPVNVNYDVPQCRSTRLAMCRGVLPYDLAGPALKVNGVEMTALLSQIEYLVATNCSDRVQHFVCALLEPECNPPPFPVKMPCYNLCKAISDSCDGLVPRDLHPVFNCNQYSSSNCLAARSPCFPRELACGDGSCVPRDWICDGASDCPAGEDEAKCVVCQPNEYKCPSGGCILKRWMCDGYADCPGGEDEAESVCEARLAAGDTTVGGAAEPGEESAGSAPAPVVRKPHRLSAVKRTKERAGDNDSSKELLVTSDSTNGLKRNYTRRPSLSRLSPYTRPPPLERPKKELKTQEPAEEVETARKPPRIGEQKPKSDSAEDVNIGDLGFFEDIEKVNETQKTPVEVPQPMPIAGEQQPDQGLTRLDKSLNKLEKVIDGAALLRKAAAQQEAPDSPESNSPVMFKDDVPRQGSSMSAHASPCPQGELRCVDGRCITLAQLCDGTIDCTDHADEDNCYT